MRITWELLREAVDAYLQLAYPSAPIPVAVQKRLVWDEQRPVLEALAAAPFENYPAKAPFPCIVHALRLGSADYPNLKLEIRPFPCKLGFVFWVNTHDEFVPVNSSLPDAEGWAQVVRRNRGLEKAVERPWAAPRLPTFTSTMQDELDSDEA